MLTVGVPEMLTVGVPEMLTVGVPEMLTVGVPEMLTVGVPEMPTDPPTTETLRSPEASVFNGFVRFDPKICIFACAGWSWMILKFGKIYSLH
ncbi:hypothetical protein Ga0466249_001983 [Sporomusaceae bacterium BoRhaA]|nr:hypothetical protein [Pelorhabdus rhamnosifermentans]